MRAIQLVVLTALPLVAVEPAGTILENDQVKVVRAVDNPHVKGKPHEHKVNRVMVYLNSGKQRFEYQDGRKPEVFDWKAGQVVWSPAGGVHSPELLSDSALSIIEVELKIPGHGGKITSLKDPLSLDKKHYKLEFENDSVRVMRVHVPAHQQIPMHEHSLNRVTVYLTDQVNRITAMDGKVDTVKRKAGETVWGTPVIHQEENMGDAPFELILIEIKK